MLKRQREGSVICTSCGVLVGVNDATCYSCGRRNPGLWGFGPALRSLGRDLGFVNLVTGGTITLYALSLILSRQGVQMMLEPSVADQLPARRERRDSRHRRGPLVDTPQRWLAARRHPAHFLQRHVDPPARSRDPANLYGAGRMVIIYTIAGVVGFALSSVMGLLPIPFFGAGITVGASASIFGMLGALVHYGRRTGSSHVGQAGLQYAIFMGIMGFVFRGVDNAAHLGGFIGGYLASRDPRSPQARTRRSPGDRRRVSRHHARRHHLVGDHRATATDLTACCPPAVSLLACQPAGLLACFFGSRLRTIEHSR